MIQRKLLPFILLIVFCLTAFKPLPMESSKLGKARAFSGDVYLVDITALNISGIDLSAGTYDVDFYITFICKTPPCTHEPAWDVMNSTEEISPQDQGTSIPFKEYDYRLKTTLIAKVDYQFYPFDYLYIEMFIEDKEHTSQELTYQLDSIEVDSMLFNPSGWYYRPQYNGGETNPVSYFGDPETFDRLDVWMFLERDRFGAFMKTIFAAIVIVMIGMLSFLMRPDSVTERLGLTSSTLVAIVLYHISLVAGVPATGYLTFVDKFMIATYVVVFFSLVVSVMLMVNVNKGNLERAEKIHQLTRWTVPSVWILLMIYVFVFELVIPYQQLLVAGGGA
ncbi:MAG: hypothetical protein U0Z26_19770 [Anaerolineales bacterium]